jgi:hypothetical protein
MATFGVAADAVVDTVLDFRNDAVGEHRGEVSIEDRPIVFDNVFHIAYRTTEKLHVLLVSGGDAASDRDIAAVFSDDSAHAFTRQAYRQLDLASLAKQDLVVLNALPDIPSGLAEALKDFADGGGSLAVFPAGNADAASYQGFLAPFGASMGARDTSGIKVERIDLRSPFFRDVFSSMPANVDLPLVRTRYAITPAPAADVLLRLQSGAPFLSATPVGKGRIYLCASPPDVSGGTFSRHALFVTSLLRMAELARPMGALYHIIGDEAAIPVEGTDLASETAPHLKGPDGIDIIPEVRRTLGGTTLVLHDEDLKPGPYAVTVDNDTLAILALDLSRSEGDLAAYTPAQLKDHLAQQGLTGITVLEKTGNELSASLKQLDQGVKLWKWFILAALLFLILEIPLIRATR